MSRRFRFLCRHKAKVCSTVLTGEFNDFFRAKVNPTIVRKKKVRTVEGTFYKMKP
jgi:hypothetical protein